MKEYGKVEINGDIPRTMKLILVFIDRVGFPVLAFCLMFWMSYSSLDKATCAISANTNALIEYRTSTKLFEQNVLDSHKSFEQQLGLIKDRFHSGLYKVEN